MGEESVAVAADADEAKQQVQARRAAEMSFCIGGLAEAY